MVSCPAGTFIAAIVMLPKESTTKCQEGTLQRIAQGSESPAGCGFACRTSLSSAQRRVAYQVLPIYTALQKNLLTSSEFQRHPRLLPTLVLLLRMHRPQHVLDTRCPLMAAAACLLGCCACAALQHVSYSRCSLMAAAACLFLAVPIVVLT